MQNKKRLREGLAELMRGRVVTDSGYYPEFDEYYEIIDKVISFFDEYDDGYDPGGPLNRTRQDHPSDFGVDLSSFGSNGANLVRQVGNAMKSIESGNVYAVEIVLHHSDGGSSRSVHNFETGGRDE